MDQWILMQQCMVKKLPLVEFCHSTIERYSQLSNKKVISIVIVLSFLSKCQGVVGYSSMTTTYHKRYVVN